MVRTGADDDVTYVLSLGIIRRAGGEYVVANSIYREVLPRALTWVMQGGIHEPAEWYVLPDGGLDLPKLMAAWQTFWRKDGHLAAEGFSYREAGPHLMLMAFLQRIVNGGGRVEREYGLGRGALDLIVEWRGARHAIEVKLRRDTETETDALEQVQRYLDAPGRPGRGAHPPRAAPGRPRRGHRPPRAAPGSRVEPARLPQGHGQESARGPNLAPRDAKRRCRTVGPRHPSRPRRTSAAPSGPSSAGRQAGPRDRRRCGQGAPRLPVPIRRGPSS